MAKINYLNNRDMLKEIHKSKNSYSEYIDEKYDMYDIILENFDPLVKNMPDDFTTPSMESLILPGYFKTVKGQEDVWVPGTIEQAKINRATRLAYDAHKIAVTEFDGAAHKKPKLSAFKIDPDTIPNTDLTIRIHTYDHIPKEIGRKKKPRHIGEEHAKLNFIPFKTFSFDEQDNLIEVGRSHYKNGVFTLNAGAMTDNLAHMYMLLVNRYSQRSNWRGYTYVDEMKGQALLQLSQMGLQFNEFKSDNPFAYFTAAITNSFTRVLNTEKRNQNIRDDVLVNAGQTPSFSRQLAHEEAIRRLREDIQESKNI